VARPNPETRGERVVVRALARTPCGSYVLLRRASTERSFPGRWELPGGRAEDGEAVGHAVVRELSEEAGLTPARAPRLVSVTRRRSPGVAAPLRELLFEVDADGEPVLSREHDAVTLYRPGTRLPGSLTESAADVLRRTA
jgi:8-oxo-dGTP diphosphatase